MMDVVDEKETRDGTTVMKGTVDGNTYVVMHHWDLDRHDLSDIIIVLADAMSGDDRGFSTYAWELQEEYDVVARNEIHKMEDSVIEREIASALNDAVCAVESKMAECDRYERRMEIAFDVVQETHEL